MDYSSIFEFDKLTLNDCIDLSKMGAKVVIDNGKVVDIKKEE